MFVKRDFVSQYKQTILGPLWFIIQPVLTTVTFMVIFGGIAKISTDGQPQVLFYMSGIMLWSYFSSCLTKTADTFTANSNIFGKVYFPRLTVPISNVISTLVTLGIQLLIFLAIYVYYIFTSNALHPNFYILLFPYLILLMAVQGLGFGIIISSLTTKYRDLKFLITFGVQLLMYATPVAYPLSVLSEKYKIWIIWNPMTAIIETFRFGALGTGTFRWEYLIYSSFVSFFVLLIGTLIFNKVEKTFMDTV
jgi:lipopolysaccharide transport system permease protein